MIGCCCVSPEARLESVSVMNVTGQLESRLNDGLRTSEFDKAFQSSCELEMKEEVHIQRDPKYIFSITFETKPLGMDITSSEYGTCAYVTNVDEKKNKALENTKLPLNSKVIRVNGKGVEHDKFEDTLYLIKDCLGNLPLILTFCHPDGLNVDERPDYVDKAITPEQ